MEWGDKVTGFEATFSLNDHKQQATFSSKGEWKRSEVTISTDEVPAAVKDGLQKSKYSIENYEPTITVDTKQIDNFVEIKIRDNGIGIPENIMSKIFHPFFTTKPTGQGTGLGLSLSYDIITKGHGGTLVLESIEEEFAEFTIKIPIFITKES